MKKHILWTLIPVVLAVSFVSGVTFAWFYAYTDPIENTFTAGTVSIIADATETLPVTILDNWNPGDCSYAEYLIENDGSKSIYLRGHLHGQWFESDGITEYIPDDPNEHVVIFDLQGQALHPKWIKVDEHWYYHMVIPGSYTHLDSSDRIVNLRIRICLDGAKTDNRYQGKIFKFTASFEAIQSSNDAITQQWPDHPFDDRNDTLDANFPPMAVFVNELFSLGGSARIYGDVGINAITENAMMLGNGTDGIVGNVYIGPTGDANFVIDTSGRDLASVITQDVNNLKEQRTFAIPDMPSHLPPHPDTSSPDLHIGPWPNQALTLSNDGFYEEITISQGGVLTIDTGDVDRILSVNHLTLLNSGHIKLTGSGRLILYVGNFHGMTGSFTVNSEKSADRLMMIVPHGSVNMSGNTLFRGGLYAPNSNVSISGSSRVIGSIVASQFDGGQGDRFAVSYEPVND